jgi:hypothetical protein
MYCTFSNKVFGRKLAREPAATLAAIQLKYKLASVKGGLLKNPKAQ